MLRDDKGKTTHGTLSVPLALWQPRQSQVLLSMIGPTD
jgi:hypothetical protein